MKLYIVKIETEILGTLYVKYDGHITKDIEKVNALKKETIKSLITVSKLRRQIIKDFDTVEDFDVSFELVEVDSSDYPVEVLGGYRKEFTITENIKKEIQELENNIERLKEELIWYEDNVASVETEIETKEEELELLKSKLDE